MASYADEHLRIDFERSSVLLDGTRVVLTRKEYELLVYLVRRAGDAIPRPILLHAIWGYASGVRTRTLDAHICRVRSKLGLYSHDYLETIFGRGYRFRPWHDAVPTHREPMQQLPMAV
jgi:DNA-binding response OmpR family regulator